MGIAACGTAKQLSAAEQVSTAFDKLGAGKSLSVAFSLDATPAQLVALSTDGNLADKLKLTDARKLSGLGATVTVTSAGKPVKDVFKAAGANSTALPQGVAVSFEVHAGDKKPLVEVRELGSKAYLRVGLDEMAALSGDKSFTQSLSDMRSGMADAPAEFAPMKALLEDKWVAVDAATLQKFGQQAQKSTGAAGVPSSMPTLDSATQTQLGDAVVAVLKRDLTLTDKGTTDGVQEIDVQAPAKQLATDLEKAVLPIVKKLPGIGNVPTSTPTDLPNGTADAQLFLKDGSLSRVSLDLAQLDASSAKKNEHLPVSLSFDGAAPAITAPAGAVELTPEVLDAMMSSMGGANGSMPSS
ncbi:hypothetical protein ABH931_002638 [Streptacidiphilus sp. MAP12-33]|uniref:hypothetical protein n=1 Tax=Streptacidiphilus sp. MAP12-33 TaxID=3156266 RepID=UPI0035152B99